MNIFNTYKNLPKSVYVLFFVQIINRFGDFVFPFLSLLLTKKLGFSFATTGLVVMTASIVVIPASLLGGKFADQLSRKKTYLIGQSLAACFILICGFIKSPSLIIVLLILSAFFNGFVRPTISAIMADVLPSEKRQAGSSLLYLGINIGVSIGPMVAGFLFNNFLPLLFIIDALTSFTAVFIVFKLIEETKPKAGNLKDTNHLEKEEHGNLLQALIKRPKVFIFLMINVLYSLAYREVSFSLPMTLNNIFTNSGSQKYGFLMSINALTVIFLTFIVINLTKKYKPLTNMVASGVFYAIGLGSIGLIGGSYPLFIISTILWTIGEIISATNKGVYMANNSPKNFRARFSAVDNLSSALGGAIGTSLIGTYMDFYGVNAVWPLIFIIASFATFLMLLLHIFTFMKK